ncbi:hypothetical protein KN815_19950 [Streptomyces sp. 4503]|uniref:Secreted protein n=1 Tax=Streptomyces niphimycinicus TaxID=2842201 RepID=A0ABS6CH54_9ACTN|nr:hypothetical protein [Streptomyces niphimycinicus]MBU3866255.1 hypothetical protein [Streptomyces niphimycinicus]
MNISRILKTAVPAAAALSLLAASPAVAADYTGCTSRSCGSVYGYRYKAIPGWDTYEIWIDSMIVRDKVKDDGSFPGIRIVYNNSNGAQDVYRWGNDNGASQQLGGKYMYDLKDVWFQVCDVGGPCTKLSRF